MRRSMRESEDEKEIKAPAGRRTRSLFAITGDCCLRRSIRINKAMENNPQEHGENSRVTRSRASTVEPEQRTPKSTSKRDVRAGSETKTMTPGRITRKTRASSVGISEDNLKDSLASWKPYGTPSRSNRRLSMLPSEPSVAEETQNLKAEKPNKSMETFVIEIEDDTDEESSKGKVPEKIEVADSGGQVAIDSAEAPSPDPKKSADSTKSPGKNGCDITKLTHTENENSLTSPTQTPRTFKPKRRSQMLMRREKEMENSGTYEDYNCAENDNEIEKKKIETDRDRHSLKDSSVDTSVIVINEDETASQCKALKSEECSILIDKPAAERSISAEKENNNPADPRENDSDCEIDVCELSQKEVAFSNSESFSRDKSAQDSGLVRSESEDSDAEIEVCDTKSIEKENIHNLNAVVVLQDILVDMKQKVTVSSVKKNEESLLNFTPKKRQSLVGVENNVGMKKVEATIDVEKEDSENGETREEAKDVSESKDEVPDRTDETKVSKSEEPKANDEFKNLEDNIDVPIEEEIKKRGSSVEKERTKSFSSQQVESCPMERATGNIEEIMEVDVKESEEKKKFVTENEASLSPEISPSKILDISAEKREIPIKTLESCPVKTSESSIKTPVLKKLVTENQTPPLSLKSPQKIANQNSPLKRCTVTISPLRLEKSVGTPDVASKSDISSEKKKSELGTLKVSTEFPAEESPVILSLQFEGDSENGTADVASSSKINSDEVKSEGKLKEEEKSSGNLNLSSELKMETLASLSQSPAQEESPGNLSLQCERKASSSLKNIEDSDFEMKDEASNCLSESPKNKSPAKSDNQTSEKEDSDIVIEDQFLDSPLESHRDVSSRKSSLQSESKSLNESENKNPDIEMKDETLNQLSESSKKKSPGDLSLRSERKTSESQNEIPDLASASLKNIQDEDSDLKMKDKPLNPLSVSLKKKSPEKSENKPSIISSESKKTSENEDSDSEIEDENSKKQVVKEKRPSKLSKRGKEKSVSPLKRMSNGSVDKNLSEFQFGYRDDENESTDEEIEALETFEKIKALQLKEREALKLKEELAALILKNESEILKLKEEMETSKSNEGLSTVNSEDFEPVKLKDDDREEIELKEKDKSIEKLVDFENPMSSAPENRGSSIVAGSPRKQTDEKEEELESLFKDITEEEFSSSQRMKNSLNLEEDSEDIVLLDEEDAEEEEKDSKPLESRDSTFNDSSVLILDHDRLNVEKENGEEALLNPTNRVKRLSVEFMRHIRHSPKKDENLRIETLRSPLKNQGTENRKSLKSEGSSDGGKKSNGPVVRKIEILKTVIPLQTLKRSEKKLETEVERTEIEEEEVNENEKKERKSLLNQSVEKPKTKKGFLPEFLNKSFSSEEEDTDSSIDTDAAMEYNLPGHKISHVDDVTGDECRSSETEEFSWNSEDEGSLADSIVNDDANFEAEETADLELERKAENTKIKKKKKQKNRNKEEPEIHVAVEERVEKPPNKQKKQKKHKSKAEIEPEVEVEKKKKKNRKLEDKVESDIQIEVKSKKEKKKMKKVLPEVPEEKTELEVPDKRKKKKKDEVLSEVPDEEIELEVPKKKKKRNKILCEVPEENIELDVKEKRKKKKTSKAEEFIAYEAKKEKKKKKDAVNEEIPQVEKEQLEPKEKKKKKKTTEVEKFPPVIRQFDLQASSEQTDKKKKKKRRKDNSEVQGPAFELQVSEPKKKKHKKVARDELLEFRNQERDIKEQEIKIRDQERRMKKQEIMIKGKEKIIQDREREMKNQERESVKEKKKKCKCIKRLPEEVLDSLSDLPQERKRPKLSNVDLTRERKKPKSKENIGKVNESLSSDLRKQKVDVPSLSMIDKKCRKIPYLVEESDSSEISLFGGTSAFLASELATSKIVPKKIALLHIRDNLLKRRRHGFTFVSQVQNQKKKHLADDENMTEDTIRLEKSKKFSKNVKKGNKK